MLFNNWERFTCYIKCIAIGLPNWFVIGVLISFSDKFAAVLGVKEAVDPGKSIMIAYVGISVGDVLIGFISQWLKSRKKALYIFYGLTILFVMLFLHQTTATANSIYWICLGLGFATGFWAIFVTMGAEQFGTNLRATAATTIPNIVRGTLPLIIILFKYLREVTDFITGAAITGTVCIALGLTAVYFSKETFGKDLDFIEL